MVTRLSHFARLRHPGCLQSEELFEGGRDLGRCRKLGGEQLASERGEHVGGRWGVLAAVPGRAGAVGGDVRGGVPVLVYQMAAGSDRPTRNTGPPRWIHPSLLARERNLHAAATVGEVGAQH